MMPIAGQNMPNNWNKTLTQAIEWPARFLENGGHAQQEIPSQHRLLNAGGMFLSWWGMDQIRNIIFGVRMKSEGEYIEVKREDVPAALRFLHKTIEWDPHSETSENQWKKLVYQFFPGVGAGVGAVMGSVYAFNRNGREQRYKTVKNQNSLGVLDADFAAQTAQAMPLRVLSGLFGTFSAASGLTFLYGFFLNPAFATANGTKVFTHSLARGNAAPDKAVGIEISKIEGYVEEALKTGKINEEWAKTFSLRVLQPMFGHELNTPEAQTKAVKTLQGIVDQSYQRFRSSGKSTKDIAKAIEKDLTAQLGHSGLDKTLKQKFGIDPQNAVLGNANPVLRHFHEFLSSVGLGKTYKVGPANTPAGNKDFSRGMIAAGGGAAALLGLGALSHSSGSHANDTASATAPGPDSPDTPPDVTTDAARENAHPLSFGHEKHPQIDTKGKTPDEYVKEAIALHRKESGEKGLPPDWLKWAADGQLAVLPINRMSCAVGLTVGQLVGGNMAKILTGYSIDGKPVDSSKVPTYLQWMQGSIKDYNPKGIRPRDRWIRYLQWGIFSAGGLIGVMLGTNYAYSNVPGKNRDPHYLEDYLPRVSMHQGGTWGWLSAIAADFGSASGLWILPIPGLNYGVSLALRATSMQDRNIMLPGGAGKFISGTATTSFLRLREGVNYLCHYAVNTPSENPAQIEYLAYTLLGPIFKDQLTAEHIQHFTEAVHKVRDPYWQEGGIPKAKRKEAMKAMREAFTGAGLEILLIKMGLNPGTIAFHQLNGMAGTIGNLGASDKIQAEQNAYHHALEEHIKTYVAQGVIAPEQADWVKSGIEAMKKGATLPPAPAVIDSTPSSPSEPASPIITLSTKFTDKAPSKNAIHDLAQRSTKPGDWRESTQSSKEQAPSSAIGA